MTSEIAPPRRRRRLSKKDAPGPVQDSQSQTDQNRWEVLSAAAVAFMEHGYAATSIDTVAAVLGATKGRVYYYYRSKADLFFDIHRAAMDLNLKTIRPIATGAGSARERLQQMLIAHVDLIMSHLPLQRVSVQGVEMHLMGSTTPAQRKMLKTLIQMRDEYEQHFLDVLAQGIAAGEFRRCEPRIVVKPLLGALNWMTLWYRPRPGETEKARRQIAEEHAMFVMQGIDGRS
ncbi:TetR/AcrR family transcriptional regulator [Rhodoligotrophos ferricapiens]|uniref:TetR/AcrR family transcriptional regulator n=1 Tax=Rhodoligotrophos ferricapiens TaxID=3069264 RepID=UPI00315D7C5B